LTREAVAAENVPGAFGVVYPVLKGLEETGRIRRGYFVAGLGATQFALPGAVDLLRSLRDSPDDVEVAVLSATDPANPYGAMLKWPETRDDGQMRAAGSTSKRSAKPGEVAVPHGTVDAAGTSGARGSTRTVGATVILVNGALSAYLARGDRFLTAHLPDAEPDRSRTGRAVARALIERARERVGADDAPRGMLI